MSLFSELPVGVEQVDDTYFLIDTDVAYPPIFAMLAVHGIEADQFGVEVVRRVLTQGIRDLVGAPIAVKLVSKSGKRPFALLNLPEGQHGKQADQLGANSYMTYYKLLVVDDGTNN